MGMPVRRFFCFNFYVGINFTFHGGMKIENKRGIDPFERVAEECNKQRENSKHIRRTVGKKKGETEANQICHFGIGLFVKILRIYSETSSPFILFPFFCHTRSIHSLSCSEMKKKIDGKRFYAKWKNFLKEYRILPSSRIY